MRDGAREFGKGLKSLWDWKKGDVMGLYTPNSIDTPLVIWGVLWAGGICSPANPAYTIDELAFQLKDSGAKALVTQKSVLPTAIAAAKSAGIPKDRIVLIGDARDESYNFKHFTSIVNLAGTNRYRRAKVDPKTDLAFLVYSSGTTGHPKGVMLSHENIVANLAMSVVHESEEHLTWDGGPDGRGDKIVCFLPFFHIYGLTCLMHFSIYTGLTLVVMSKYDIERFCSVIQNWKITFAYVVPPVVLQLGKHPVVDKFDLSSLRMMNSGAAPLTRELVDTVYKRIKVPIKQGYGLSETSPTTHSQQWKDWYTTLGSVGKLLPNQTAKYMSPDEHEVPVGDVGELWIKGPNIFKGYHNNPEGTRNALTSDGYFKTGDVGYQDRDGNFYITDRIKELIKYKGFQVAPAELEGLLMSHPLVNDAAVTAYYDKSQATEIPRAYIVVKQGSAPSPQLAGNIVAWIESKVANHKRLRGGVKFVDEIPKTASGKILRRKLKLQAEEEEKGPLKARL